MNHFIGSTDCKLYSSIVLLLLILAHFSIANNNETSKFIIYCPCMGRFGNQAEQLLGSVHFAKSINRIIVIPPFISFVPFLGTTSFTPAEDVIDIDALKKYHSKIMTMNEFMKISDDTWPRGERIIYCYSQRMGKDGGCNALDGNPFKAFWNHIGIDGFDKSIFYGPLKPVPASSYDWMEKFGANKVIAFTGAPSPFPIPETSLHVGKYLKLSSKLLIEGQQYAYDRGIQDKKNVAIHVRHGSDWIRACNLLKESPTTYLFSSQQCNKNHQAILPYEMCIPPLKSIISELRKVLISDPTIEYVYIATDDDKVDYWTRISRKLKIPVLGPSGLYKNGSQVQHFQQPPTSFQDIYILATADYFIGNCISSFTAFISRVRNEDRRTFYFVESLLSRSISIHTEL